MKKRFLKISLTKNITYSSLFIAMGLLLPQLFHSTETIGSLISPMHIPILICAFFLDWPFALAVGALTPVLSNLLMGMPPYHMMLIMAFELAGYALTANLIYTRVMPRLSKRIKPGIINIYISLAAAMIAGRLLGACVAPAAFSLFGAAGYAGFFVYLLRLFTGGVTAIVLQLLLIPPIVEILKRYTVPVNTPAPPAAVKPGEKDDPESLKQD